MSADIQIKGFDKFEAILNKLPDDIAKNVALKALKDGAKVILEEAQNLVPEGATGKLADSLAIKAVKSKFPTYRVYARRSKGYGGWHANFVEFGTAAHEIKNVIIDGKFYPVIHHPGAPPTPFMRPALMNKKNETIHAVFENVFKHITNTIKKEMK